MLLLTFFHLKTTFSYATHAIENKVYDAKICLYKRNHWFMRCKWVLSLFLLRFWHHDVSKCRCALLFSRSKLCCIITMAISGSNLLRADSFVPYLYLSGRGVSPLIFHHTFGGNEQTTVNPKIKLF